MTMANWYSENTFMIFYLKEVEHSEDVLQMYSRNLQKTSRDKSEPMPML